MPKRSHVRIVQVEVLPVHVHLNELAVLELAGVQSEVLDVLGLVGAGIARMVENLAGLAGEGEDEALTADYHVAQEEFPGVGHVQAQQLLDPAVDQDTGPFVVQLDRVEDGSGIVIENGSGSLIQGFGIGLARLVFRNRGVLHHFEHLRLGHRLDLCHLTGLDRLEERRIRLVVQILGHFRRRA